jgi:hypothetical protein
VSIRFRQSTANLLAAVIGLVGALALAAQRWWLLPLLLPFLVWLTYAVRVGTDAGPAGLRLRSLLRSRRIAWSDVESLAGVRRGVAVRLTNGRAVMLPSVRPDDVGRLLATSGNRLQAADQEQAR